MRTLTLIFLFAMLAACGSATSDAPTTSRGGTWYEGGTLHDASAAAWLAGTPADRLATAGDIFTRYARKYQPDLIDQLSDAEFNSGMRAYAMKMSACITKRAQNKKSLVHQSPMKEGFWCFSGDFG